VPDDQRIDEPERLAIDAEFDDDLGDPLGQIPVSTERPPTSSVPPPPLPPRPSRIHQSDDN